MSLHIIRWLVVTFLVFFIFFFVSEDWFKKQVDVAHIPITDLEQLNVLAQKVGTLLEQPESVKNGEIQQLIDQEAHGPFHLLYLDWQVKLVKTGTKPPQFQHKFFEWVNESEVHLTIPVGINRVKGLLVATRSIPEKSVTNPYVTRAVFSAGITAFVLSFLMWLKTRKLTLPIDELCQQFTRYRREHETTDIRLPETQKYQTDLERRVAILRELWIKFQSTQDQLATKVRELEESKAQLEKTIHDLELAKEQEQRLVELGYALAEFGHDIGNANGSIMTYITLILQVLDKDRVDMMDVARSLIFIRRIKISSVAISGLTSDLLEFAKGKTVLRKEVQHLDSFISQLEAHTGFAADVPIEFQTTNPHLQFCADGGKLLRVIVNLVKNAWEKLEDEDNGCIDISFDSYEGDGLIIQVQDNGSPIPEDLAPRLFQSFKSQGKETGTGLGLAICKKIVEAHQGTINAENLGNGQGVKFVIALPHCVSINTRSR
ncbi:HAMP domain-containing sensor histidine kinase [Deltaproteobacteria bacterium TL4]